MRDEGSSQAERDDLIAEGVDLAKEALERDPKFQLSQLPPRFHPVRSEIASDLRRAGFGTMAGGEGASKPPRHERFEKPEEIAFGANGAVFRAYDRDLKRQVAVKVARGAGIDAESVKRRLHREAEIGAQLQHHGIVPVHDLITDDDGQLCLVMAFVDGDTLHRRMAEQQMTLEELLDVFETVCETLAYAHARQYAGAGGRLVNKPCYIHADIKPGNVLVSPFGQVQLIDWGEAREVKLDAGLSARSALAVNGKRGGAVGTAQYMSPEAAVGFAGRLCTSSDVFSLGALLCHFLTGAPPYRGNNPLDQATRHDLGDARERLWQLAWEKPSWEQRRYKRLVRLCLACLGSWSERPRDAGTVLAALKAFRITLAREEAQTARELQEARLREEKRRGRQRVKRVILAAVFLVVGVVAAGLWYSARRATEVVASAVTRAEDSVRGGKMSDLRDAKGLLAQAKRALGLSLIAGRLRGRLLQLEGEVSESIAQLEKQTLLARRTGEAAWLGGARLLGLDLDWGPSVRAFHAAFADYGTPLAQDPADLEAGLERLHPSLRGDVVADVRLWLLFSKRDRPALEAVLRRVDPDPWWDALLEAIDAADVKKVLVLAEKAKGTRLPASSYRALGEALLAADRPTEAVELMSRAVEAWPTEAPLHVLRGRGLVERFPPKTKEAIESFSTAVTHDPHNPIVRSHLAAALQEMGRYEESKRHYAAAFAEVPESPYVKVLQVSSRYLRGEPDDLRDLETVANEYKERGDLLALLAFKLAPRENQLWQARLLLERAKKNASDKHPRVVLARAMIALCSKQYQSYYDDVRQLRQSFPNDSTLAQAEAFGLLLVGRAEEGEAFARRCLAEPGIPLPLARICHDLLSIAWLKKGRPRESEAASAEAARLDAMLRALGDKPTFRMGMLQALMQQARFDEAARYLQQAEHDRVRWAVGPMASLLIGLGRIKKSLDDADETGWKPPLRELKGSDVMALLAGRWEEVAEAASPLLMPEVMLADDRPGYAYLWYQMVFKGASLARPILEAMRSPIWSSDVLVVTYRVNAARAAVRSACDAGRFGILLDPKVKAQALDSAHAWLRDELAAQEKACAQADGRPGAQAVLYFLRHCPELAGVRDEGRLKALSAKERQRWAAFWRDVDLLFARAVK